MIVQNYQFLKRLGEQPFVEAIWLFGSRARQDHQERADIDLAVFCPKAQDTDWFKILDIIDDADTLLKIDCVRLDQLKETSDLKKAIMQQGVKLYTQSR